MSHVIPIRKRRLFSGLADAADVFDPQYAYLGVVSPIQPIAQQIAAYNLNPYHWHTVLARGYGSGTVGPIGDIAASLNYRAEIAGFPGWDWGPAIRWLLYSMRMSNPDWPGSWYWNVEHSSPTAIVDDIVASAEGNGFAPWTGAGLSVRVAQSERQAAEADTEYNSPEAVARRENTGLFGDPLMLIVMAVAAYYAIPYLSSAWNALSTVAEGVAASGATEAVVANAVATEAATITGASEVATWEEVAAGWEASVATTAVQNAALAEVAGDVAAGTLAATIGEEAAAAALIEANALTQTIAQTIAQVAAETITRTTTAPTVVNATVENILRYASQVLQYGAALYRMIQGTGSQSNMLFPRQIGTVDANGNISYITGASGSTGDYTGTSIFDSVGGMPVILIGVLILFLAIR